VKTHYKIILTLAVIILLGDSSFAQKSRSKAKPKKTTTVAGAFDTSDFLGAVDDSEYKNSFFGLKVSLPESWIIQEKEVNDELKQIGESGVKGKTRKIQKSFDQAAQKVTILLTATRDIIGIADNAVLSLVVEKPLPPFRIKNGNDYLRLALQSYKLLQLPPDYKYSENIRSETLGGETFYYIDVQQAGFTQRFYATARKGYAVFFLVQFFKAEDLETMKEILRNSDFAWKG